MTATASTLPTLINTRRLLNDPSSWTQRGFQLSSSGKILGSTNPNGVCFCLYGAMVRVGGVIPSSIARQAIAESAGFDIGMIPKWNDDPSRTHDDILEALDGATELVRNAIESLVKTRELLSESSAWTKNAFRKDANGQSIKPGDTETVAACRCLIAAMSDANGRRVDKVARWAMQETTGSTALAEWNDDKDRTHSEVLDAIDKAIFLLRGD